MSRILVGERKMKWLYYQFEAEDRELAEVGLEEYQRLLDNADDAPCIEAE